MTLTVQEGDLKAKNCFKEGCLFQRGLFVSKMVVSLKGGMCMHGQTFAMLVSTTHFQHHNVTHACMHEA